MHLQSASSSSIIYNCRKAHKLNLELKKIKTNQIWTFLTVEGKSCPTVIRTGITEVSSQASDPSTLKIQTNHKLNFPKRMETEEPNSIKSKPKKTLQNPKHIKQPSCNGTADESRPIRKNFNNLWPAITQK